MPKKAAGRKPKLPGLQLVKDGGENPFALQDAIPAGETLKPPHALDVNGRGIWTAACRTLTLVGELSHDHMYGLYQLSYAWQRMAKKMEAGQEVDWKEHDQMRKMMQEFGLTPASRMQMDPDGSKTRQRPNGGSYLDGMKTTAREATKKNQTPVLQSDNPFTQFLPGSAK